MTSLLNKCRREGSRRELEVMRSVPDDLVMLTMVGDARLADDPSSGAGGGKKRGTGAARGRKPSKPKVSHKKGER